MQNELSLLTASGGADKLYVDDVFSTYLYTGNGSTQTITNGINLSGQGGLVWIKDRTQPQHHVQVDSARSSFGKALASNLTNAENTNNFDSITALSSGFTVGVGENSDRSNFLNIRYSSWTFRKAPKFFDVVTYTGNMVDGRAVSHNLGSTPGMIIVKITSGSDYWGVWHRGTAGATDYLKLDQTNAATSAGTIWFSAPDASNFYLKNNTMANASGATYVAYLFAHDTATDGIIQCGSYAGNGSTTGPTVTLGWEPQYVMIKNASAGSSNWIICNSMSGMFVGGNENFLLANDSGAEQNGIDVLSPTATGFQIAGTNFQVNGSGDTLIYIAIRRSNKPPTSGTQVYNGVARTGTGAAATITTGFVTDAVFTKTRAAVNAWGQFDRLRGRYNYLKSNTNGAEATDSTTLTGFDVMTGVTVGTDTSEIFINDSGRTYITYGFRRAPGFFDVVCFTGSSGSQTINHSLGVAPELVIVKNRVTAGYNWFVYAAPLGFSTGLGLNANNGTGGFGCPVSATTTTSFTLTLGTSQYNMTNEGSVAYLFATLPGISKVGSYTGNGSSQTINCGFTTGARFVMIKRTDSTGDWYVWDSARGIVAGNDPHLSLNTTAAEVTTDDSIDPDSTGFVVNQDTATNINVNAATYIFLAIA